MMDRLLESAVDLGMALLARRNSPLLTISASWSSACSASWVHGEVLTASRTQRRRPLEQFVSVSPAISKSNAEVDDRAARADQHAFAALS